MSRSIGSINILWGSWLYVILKRYNYNGLNIMQEYRLVMQYKNQQGKFINNEIIVSGEIKIPKEIIDLGLRHADQIEILQKIQDSLLNKQSE